MPAPQLPGWATFEGDAYGAEFASWHAAPCARAGCGVARWAHIANALAERRGAPGYWTTCAAFEEPTRPQSALPVASTPGAPDGGRWERGAAAIAGAESEVR